MDPHDLGSRVRTALAEQVSQGFVLRRSADGMELETGATVDFVATEGYIVEIRSDGDELPERIRIDSLSGQVEAYARGETEQESVVQLDAPEADALRLYSLLDPRVVAQQLRRVRTYVTGPVVRYLGYVRLDKLPAPLPPDYVEYLSGGPLRSWHDWAFDVPRGFEPVDALDHPCALMFEERRLVELRQPDLYPFGSDVIIVRFA